MQIRSYYFIFVFILFPYKLGRKDMGNASDVDIQVLIALKWCTRV